MENKLKPGSGILPGLNFQRWIAVKLICDWFKEPKKENKNVPWLAAEIGNVRYGIFDDILMYKDSIYYFYQMKHTISLIGDTIELEHLTDTKHSNISIDKMYESYKKITSLKEYNAFILIICTNKSIDSTLRRIIDNKKGKFKNFNPCSCG